MPIVIVTTHTAAPAMACALHLSLRLPRPASPGRPSA